MRAVVPQPPRRTALAYALLCVAAVCVLYPTLATGWFGDDAYYSNLPAAVATGRLTLLGAALNSYEGWLHSAGRWHPGLVAETFATFWLFRDRVAYKTLLIVLSLLALFAGGDFFARMWGRRFAIVAMLWTIACFQLRGYHDPILAYNGIVQSVAVLVFVSLSTFVSYARSGRKRLLIACIASYVAACTVYEIAYVFAPLYVVAAWNTTRLRRALVLAAPMIAIGIAFLAVAAILRVQAHVDPASPYAVRPDTAAYLSGLLDQTTAALPLSYLVLNPSKIFLPPWHGFGIHYGIVAFALAALCAFVALPNERLVLSSSAKKTATLLGVLLVVLPAIEIPALVKYQNELHLGLGYLPVFVEYFGVGLLAAVGTARLAFDRSQRAIAIVAFAAIVTLSSGADRKLAEILAQPYLTSRESFQRAIAAGMLRSVPSGSTLAITPDLPWVCPDGACIDDMRTSDAILAESSKIVIIRSPATAAFVAAYDPATDRWSVGRAKR